MALNKYFLFGRIRSPLNGNSLHLPVFLFMCFVCYDEKLLFLRLYFLLWVIKGKTWLVYMYIATLSGSLAHTFHLSSSQLTGATLLFLHVCNIRILSLFFTPFVSCFHHHDFHIYHHQCVVEVRTHF